MPPECPVMRIALFALLAVLPADEEKTPGKYMKPEMTAVVTFTADPSK